MLNFPPRRRGRSASGNYLPLNIPSHVYREITYILEVDILRLTCIVFAGIETLPQELQRNFTLMRDLDQRAEGKITKK